MKNPAQAEADKLVQHIHQQRQQMSMVEMDEEDDVAGAGGSSMMMEVDDGADPIDVLSDFDKHLVPVDSDFFNSFADDFDDADLA